MTGEVTVRLSARPTHVFYFDILRIAAVFMVVMLHVSTRALVGQAPLYDSAWNCANAFNSLCRCAVSVFVMISGALFLDRDIPIRRLYSKYILRIIRDFSIWSVFYSTIGLLFDLFQHTPLSVGVFLRHCLTGIPHQWFLFMIAGLYLIVPFLRRIAENPCLCRLFLVLGFFFALFLPESISVATLCSPACGEVMKSMQGKMQMHFLLGFPIYFVWRFWLHTQPVSSIFPWMCVGIGRLGVVLTYFLTAWASARAGQLDETFYMATSNVTVFLPATALFAICKHLFSKAKGWFFGGRIIPAMGQI